MDSLFIVWEILGQTTASLVETIQLVIPQSWFELLHP
jgi:hypothetical protein